MTELTDLSETDADNTPISGTNIAEGCAPSGINNAIRSTLGLVRRAFKTSIFRVRDATDQTKLLAFNLGSLTTAITRTLTVQDKDGTIALTSDIPTVIPPKGHLYGLTLSNGSDATNDIDIAAGEASSDGATPVLIALATALTKRLDAAWAVGTGNGGLDTGSIADVTYHLWLIRRSDTGVVDALFSASASAPTMPASYDQKRRIGSIVRTSGAIKAFDQVGDEFYWKASVVDVSVSPSSPTASTVTLTVPIGVVVDARVSARLNSNGPVVGIWLSPLTVNDQAPGVGGYTAETIGALAATGPVHVRTNTAGQIRRREGDINAAVSIFTEGYIDRRGRV